MRARSWLGAPASMVVVALALPVATPAADSRHLNLYDWMFPAEVVVAGRAMDEAGKNTAVVVDRVIRGDMEEGEILQIQVRRANRLRDEDDSRLKLEAAQTYILLLKPQEPKEPDGPVSYGLIRGVYGARRVPKEGASAVLDAAERFAQVQAVNDDSVHWHAFEMMLEDTNPILIQTALQEYLKFMRGTPETVPRLRPLLQHPRPDVRESALKLSGFLLERYPPDEFPDVGGLEMDIIALARRDPSVEVRVAAAEALRGLADPGVDQIWEEISRDDPDQNVRYTAERLLYERAQSRQTGQAAKPR